MSVNEGRGEKTSLSPKDIGIIIAAIAAVAVAVAVVMRTVNANRVHDVIVIKGAKGAKPMGNEQQAPAASEAEPAGDGASDRPLKVP